MWMLLAVLVFGSVIGVASAALKPIETDIRPVDNKAVAVYKTTPQGDLKINLYFPHFPPNWKAGERRPAIAFFFGGSCATGSPAQFAATAEHFAARGMIAATPEYRIESIHYSPPERCIEDGKSAIRWLRMSARHLGIDRRRVIAGGGSSGASIAAFAAYNTAFEPEEEDRSISPEPCPGAAQSRLRLPARSIFTGRALRGDGELEGRQSRSTDHLVLRHGRSSPRGRPWVHPKVDRRWNPRGVLHHHGPTSRLLHRFPKSPWRALVLRQIDVFLTSLGYLKGNAAVGVPADIAVTLHKERL
jgi:hypothetical protein